MMATFEFEIIYNKERFEVYLRSAIAGREKREHIITVWSDHPSIDINDFLLFAIKKLSWIFTERDQRFMKNNLEVTN